MKMMDIPWDQPATLIDLDGKTPVIGTMNECVLHFSLFKPFAKAQARILLTRPVFREGQKTRTWIVNPDEIAALVERRTAEVESGVYVPPAPDTDALIFQRPSGGSTH